MPKDFTKAVDNALAFTSESLSKDFINQDSNARLKLGIESIKQSAEKLQESLKEPETPKAKQNNIDLAIILAKDINYTNRIAASLPPESKGKPPGRPKYENLLSELAKDNAKASDQGPAIQAAGVAQYLLDFKPLKDTQPGLNPKTEAPLIQALTKLRDDSKKLALEVVNKKNEKPYDLPDVATISRDFDNAIKAVEANLPDNKQRKGKNSVPSRPVYKEELLEAQKQFLEAVKGLTVEKKVSVNNPITPEIQEAAKLAVERDPNFVSSHQMTGGRAPTKNTGKSIT